MMPTLDFWIRLPLAGFIIVGVWALFGKGMLLEPIGKWTDKWMSRWVQKPLFDCPPCQSSVWGTAVWFSTGGDWLWWIPFCLALCGILKIVAHNLLN